MTQRATAAERADRDRRAWLNRTVAAAPPVTQEQLRSLQVLVRPPVLQRAAS